MARRKIILKIITCTTVTIMTSHCDSNFMMTIVSVLHIDSSSPFPYRILGCISSFVSV